MFLFICNITKPFLQTLLIICITNIAYNELCRKKLQNIVFLYLQLLLNNLTNIDHTLQKILNIQVSFFNQNRTSKLYQYFGRSERTVYYYYADSIHPLLV